MAPTAAHSEMLSTEGASTFAHDNIDASPAVTPPLIALPAELRNTIYHLVLTEDDPIDVEPTTFVSKVALTQTCSQIRKETAPIFYKNSFRVDTQLRPVGPTRRWLEGLKHHAYLIRELLFEHDGGETFRTAYALRIEQKYQYDADFK